METLVAHVVAENAASSAAETDAPSQREKFGRISGFYIDRNTLPFYLALLHIPAADPL